MTAKTHLLGGLFAGQLLCLAAGAGSSAVPPLVLGGLAGALIPDIDHRGSKISRSSAPAKLTSLAISGITRHRGVIHTPLFALAFVLAGAFLSPFFPQLIRPALLMGLLAGMISHLALDTLNPTGILWLWPLSRKRLHLARITTGSMGELAVTGLLTLLNAGIAAWALPGVLNQMGQAISALF